MALDDIECLDATYASLGVADAPPLDQPHRRAQWQSHLGWDNVPNVNESRRHSLADIPTRRGSLAGGEPSHLSRAHTHQEAVEDGKQTFTVAFAPGHSSQCEGSSLRDLFHLCHIV